MEKDFLQATSMRGPACCVGLQSETWKLPPSFRFQNQNALSDYMTWNLCSNPQYFSSRLSPYQFLPWRDPTQNGHTQGKFYNCQLDLLNQNGPRSNLRSYACYQHFNLSYLRFLFHTAWTMFSVAYDAVGKPQLSEAIAFSEAFFSRSRQPSGPLIHFSRALCVSVHRTHFVTM